MIINVHMFAILTIVGTMYTVGIVDTVTMV